MRSDLAGVQCVWILPVHSIWYPKRLWRCTEGMWSLILSLWKHVNIENQSKTLYFSDNYSVSFDFPGLLGRAELLSTGVWVGRRRWCSENLLTVVYSQPSATGPGADTVTIEVSGVPACTPVIIQNLQPPFLVLVSNMASLTNQTAVSVVSKLRYPAPSTTVWVGCLLASHIHREAN